MSPTAAAKPGEKEEALASLPINHPQAGYVEPDLSYVEGREPPTDEDVLDKDGLKKNVTMHSFNPADENTFPRPREENISRREEELKAVGEAEDKAVKEEAKADEAEAKKQASTAASTPAASEKSS